MYVTYMQYICNIFIYIFAGGKTYIYEEWNFYIIYIWNIYTIYMSIFIYIFAGGKTDTYEEWNAIRSLTDDRNIIIKKAGKGSCIVIWGRNDYLLEAK